MLIFSTEIKLTKNKKEFIDDDQDELFLHNWLTAKGVKPYFQPNLFSHILKIASTAQKMKFLHHGFL